MLGTLLTIAKIAGRSIIPAALTAVGVNNTTDLIPPADVPASIPMTGDHVVDGLAILAVVARIVYVKVKKKRQK